MYLLNTLGRHQWALPLLVEVTQGRDKPMTFAAVKHIERITGRKFGDPIRDRYGAMARKEVAAWWESEGKAKYGEPRPQAPGAGKSAEACPPQEGRTLNMLKSGLRQP